MGDSASSQPAAPGSSSVAPPNFFFFVPSFTKMLRPAPKPRAGPGAGRGPGKGARHGRCPPAPARLGGWEDGAAPSPSAEQPLPALLCPPAAGLGAGRRADRTCRALARPRSPPRRLRPACPRARNFGGVGGREPEPEPEPSPARRRGRHSPGSPRQSSRL